MSEGNLNILHRLNFNSKNAIFNPKTTIRIVINRYHMESQIAFHVFISARLSSIFFMSSIILNECVHSLCLQLTVSVQSLIISQRPDRISDSSFLNLSLVSYPFDTYRTVTLSLRPIFSISKELIPNSLILSDNSFSI